MDWNQDGHLDILSGCYWIRGADAGHIQMLAGNGSLNFAESEAINNVAGDPLQNEEIRKPEKGVGRSMAENQTSTICTHQHAVDYDGDGDLDLVVGCFGNSFYLYENIGTGDNIALSEKPVKLPVLSTSNHSAPHLVDWDGDGDLDLLSGTASGGAIISENTGTREKPEWSAFKQLIAPSNRHEQNTFNVESIEPASSTRIWATDWNRDGLLDLLVGDCVNSVNPADGIEPAEYERRLAAFNREMADVQKKQEAVVRRHQAAIKNGEQPDEELNDEMERISAEFVKVRETRKEFQVSKRTGFVWLFVRKPAAPGTRVAIDGQRLDR